MGQREVQCPCFPSCHVRVTTRLPFLYGNGNISLSNIVVHIGENVVVVIGGDDNYKNETEEEQSVISRWAWRRIARPQFSEEFIDGRKGFVFSWDKKHREIHEDALLHFFDPEKKGQKFEYQPHTIHTPADPVGTQAVVFTNDERTSRENKQDHPLSQVTVAQDEKLSYPLSSGFTNEKTVTRPTEEGAQAKVELPVVITEEREPEGKGNSHFSVRYMKLHLREKSVSDLSKGYYVE